MNDNWTLDMFPGDGLEIPTDAERDRADAIIAKWAGRWGEGVVTIDRRHPDGAVTNRAFIRSRLWRWWRGNPIAAES